MNWREQLARACGLWPVYGRVLWLFYSWAQSEIDPSHPDAVYVGSRFASLVREFGPLFPSTRKAKL